MGVAFNITNPEALICGYVIATLLAMISPVPQGVGFVEAGVMVLFSAYDINSAAGMASVLVYRGLVFWMPFLIGAVLIQRTKTFKRDDGKKGKPDKPVALPTASNDDALVDAVAGESCDAAVEEFRDAAVIEKPRDVAAEVNEEGIAEKGPVDDGEISAFEKTSVGDNEPDGVVEGSVSNVPKEVS